MADIKDQKLLYHLTSLSNIRSILDSGLQPRSAVPKFHDIADPEILNGRQRNSLHDYVPFHWFSRNPFDGRVQKDRPEEDFVLITVRRVLAQARNWKVIPRHPLANATIELYDYEEGVGLIEWDTMQKREYWDAHCKSVCMAECLSPSPVKVSEFFKIYVPTAEIENRVVNEINRCRLSVDVVVNKGMFC